MRTTCPQCKLNAHQDKGAGARKDTMMNISLTNEYKDELWRRAVAADMCLTHYFLWCLEEAHQAGAEPVPLTDDPRDATYGPEPERIAAPEFAIDPDGEYANLLVVGPGNRLADIQGRQDAERARLKWCRLARMARDEQMEMSA
jgi:hypothetical protein